MDNKTLLQKFTKRVETCQERMDKFLLEFTKDPAYALSWSNNTFKDAAELRVNKQIMLALQDGDADLDNIRSTLMERVLHKSKYPPQSTSPTSNLIEQYELAVCSDILSDLQYYE